MSKPPPSRKSRPPRPAASPPVAHPPAASPDAPQGVRLSKVMAERGLCSRREADVYIERGWVRVDGQTVSELGTRIDPNATITLTPQARASQQRRVTLLLHKPVGYVSGQPEPGFKPAVSLIGPRNQFQAPGDPSLQPANLRGLAPAG
nr:S4 domain-containing protein [Thiobacillaceae bacterium]